MRLLCLGIGWAASTTLAWAATTPAFDLTFVDGLLARAVPGQDVVYMGDMGFKVSYLEHLRTKLSQKKSEVGIAAASPNGITLWTGGTVPYAFNSNVNSTQKGQWEAACREWEKYAKVKFVPWTTQANYVRVNNTTDAATPSNSSQVGMQGGAQTINIVSWNSKPIICHEIAHALGVCHEQSRSDRDTYVTINTGNIESGKENNFYRLNTNNQGTPYDFDSVMHYGIKDFSSNGLDTITPKPGYEAAAARIGQRRYLSYYDKAGMVKLYGGPNLAFHLPAGWSDKMVVSTVAGTNTDSSSFNSSNTLYIDVAPLNSGTIPVGDGWTARYYVDNVQVRTESFNPGLAANTYYSDVVDKTIGPLSAGTHIVKVVVDADNAMAETDETDNVYQKSITVTGTQTPPTVTTTPASSIASTSATTGGNVTSAGGGTVTERGVRYDTEPGSALSSGTYVRSGSGTGPFTTNLSGLNASTTYYVSAYAINSAGTSYGSEISFTTQASPVSLPTVTTTSAGSITSNSANTGGSMDSDGGGTVTERGVVYATTQNPTTSTGTKVTSGSGYGNFASNLIGLTPLTTYYVRAYAINSAGTAYGSQISFTTWGGLSINPTSQTVAAAGGSHSFSVTASGIWSWSKSAGSSWVTSAQPASQSGSQTFSYTVAANTNPTPRTATITLATGSLTATHYITQAGTQLSTGTVVAWGDNSLGQTSVPGGLSDVTAIAGGAAHSVVLKSNGTVVAWGYNVYGQTTPPEGLSGVTAIAAGWTHTVALKSNGTVVAWGSNLYGETRVPASLSGVTAIAAGIYTVALKSDGTVVAWGDNPWGQTIVPADLSGVTAIAAGYDHAVALKSNGTVVAWGYNGDGQTSVPAGLSGVTAIAAGGYHTVALKGDGTVVAWGYNEYGQTSVPAGLSGVTAIAAGYYHTVALKNNGAVVAWGNNGSGQTSVPGGLGDVTAIAAGGSHTVALKGDTPTRIIALSGDLAFGSVEAGQTATRTLTLHNMGNSALNVADISYPAGFTGSWSSGSIAAGGSQNVTVTFSPAAVQSYSGTVTVTTNATSGTHTRTISGTGTPPPVLFIDSTSHSVAAAGGSHSFNVTASGSWSWSKSAGSSWVGISEAASQSGTQTFSYKVAANKNPTPRAARITLATGALTATHYITQAGTRGNAGIVVAWGLNAYGQTTVPTGLSGVTALAASASHTVALKSDGTMVAWGWNGYGQTNVPEDLSGVTAIAAGWAHTVALKNDGTVVAWGDNSQGQTSVPGGLSDVTAIAGGASHTVALKGDGTVVAWGYNGDGQTSVPTGLSGVTAIAAGLAHTVALKSDGTVVAWGYNGDGQTSVPTGLSGVTAIAAGGRHTAALKSNGTVVAWGWNESGQTSVPAGLSGVTAIAAGGRHTLALKSNGALVAWGDNTNGQRTIPKGLTNVTAIAAGLDHTVVLGLSPVSLTLSRQVPGAVTSLPDKAGSLAFKAAPSTAASRLSNGSSSILPNTLVTVTATAKAGYLFSHWDGLPADAQEAGNVVSFPMPAAPLTSLTAVFIENPFYSAPLASLGAQPVFQGLLKPENATASSNATVGLLDTALTRVQGSLSGRVFMDGRITSYTGTLRGDGSVWFKVRTGLRRQLPLLDGQVVGKTLSASWSSLGLEATVSSSAGPSRGLAQPPLYSKTGPILPASGLLDSTGKQGLFTLALQPPLPATSEQASTYPQGAGYSSLTLTNDGVLKLAGALADGAKITASRFLVQGDKSAVFLQLPTPGAKTQYSSLSGVLMLGSGQPGGHVTSAGLQWFRAPAVTSPAVAQSYRAGWPDGITLETLGAFYDGTRTVQNTLGLGATNPTGNATLAFTDGQLHQLAKAININGSKLEKLDAKDTSFTLSFTPKTGLFVGYFTPNWTSPTKQRAFQGILIQREESKGGYGYFLNTYPSNPLNPESGAVKIH